LSETVLQIAEGRGCSGDPVFMTTGIMPLVLVPLNAEAALRRASPSAVSRHAFQEWAAD